MRPLLWSTSYLLRTPLGISIRTSNSTGPRSCSPFVMPTSVDHDALSTLIGAVVGGCEIARTELSEAALPDDPQWPTQDDDIDSDVGRSEPTVQVSRPSVDQPTMRFPLAAVLATPSTQEPLRSSPVRS